MLNLNDKFKLKTEPTTNKVSGRQITTFSLNSTQYDSLTFRCPVNLTGGEAPHKDYYIIIKNAVQDRFITPDSGGKNLTIGGPAVEIEVEKISKAEEIRSEQVKKRDNQAKIISWINDNFSLTIDSAGFATNKDGSESISLGNIENPNVIFQTIKQYITNNAHQFRLGDEFITLPFDKHGIRPWWTPQVPWTDPRNVAQKTPGKDNHGMVVSSLRVIQLKDSPNFRIHPNAFREEGYEELKNLIPGTCRVKGCYSNFCNNYLGRSVSEAEMFSQKYNSDYNFAVVDGLCGYHRMLQSGESNQGSTAGLSPEDIAYNQKVTEYLNRVQPTLRKFTELLAQVSNGNESKFYEIDHGISLINQILNKCNEDEAGVCAKSLPFLPHKIEVGDSRKEKSTKQAYFVNQVDKLVDDIIVKKKKEVITLIEELLCKQDEYINNKPQNQTPNGNRTNQTLSALCQKTIQTIRNALHSQSPQVANSELETDNRQWERQINRESATQAEIENIRDRVLADISNKRAAKFDADRLRKLIQEAKGIQNYEKLSQKLKQIESFRGQKEYHSLKTEIDALENRLAELAQTNPKKYQQDSTQEIKENLEQKGVKESELSTETKKDLEKVKKGEITNPTEVRKIKEKSLQEINQKEAENKLIHLLKEFEVAVTSRAKEEAKKKIITFVFSNNSAYQQAYQKNKSQVNNIIGIKDENQNQQEPGQFPYYPVIIIGSVLAVAVFSVFIIRYYRLRQKRKSL